MKILSYSYTTGYTEPNLEQLSLRSNKETTQRRSHTHMEASYICHKRPTTLVRYFRKS